MVKLELLPEPPIKKIKTPEGKESAADKKRKTLDDAKKKPGKKVKESKSVAVKKDREVANPAMTPTQMDECEYFDEWKHHPTLGWLWNRPFVWQR